MHRLPALMVIGKFRRQDHPRPGKRQLLVTYGARVPGERMEARRQGQPKSPQRPSATDRRTTVPHQTLQNSTAKRMAQDGKAIGRSLEPTRDLVAEPQTPGSPDSDVVSTAVGTTWLELLQDSPGVPDGPARRASRPSASHRRPGRNETTRSDAGADLGWWWW